MGALQYQIFATEVLRAPVERPTSAASERVLSAERLSTPASKFM